jgi:putative transposase
VLATPHPEYLALQSDSHRRHAAYRELFQDALDDLVVSEIRDATHGSLPLGSDSFKAALSAKGRRVERGRPGPRPGGSEGEDQVEIVL